MAKKSLIEKNNKILLKSEKNAKKRQEMSKILLSSSSFGERLMAAKFLEQTRLSAKNRHRNRCKLTGRPRAYRGKFGICGFKLRELSGYGMVMGVIKMN